MATTASAPAARARIVESIAAGGLVCVAADTPPRPGTGLVPVQFPQDREAWWRSGVLKLALEVPGPKRCFDMHINWNTGHRHLRLVELAAAQTLGGLVGELNELFLAAFSRQRELWFYWPAPQGFLLFPAGARLESSEDTGSGSRE